MQDDYTAVALALHAGTSSHPDAPRLVRIHDTLHVEQMLISAPLVAEARAAGHAVGPDLGPLAFTSDGQIAPWPEERRAASSEQ
jgi:hypothetical protein